MFSLSASRPIEVNLGQFTGQEKGHGFEYLMTQIIIARADD
jgi:hypothetical protein